MHEIGVLCQVVREVEKVAKANDLSKVDGVVLQIGELTGMMPLFFEEYYDMVTEDHPVVAGSELKIETIPGIGRCLDCGAQYNVAEHEGACPECGSRKKDILSGREFLIKEIMIYEEDAVNEKTGA